jgi:hypothetical protein
LTETTRKGKESAREVLLARALLLLDEGEFGVERWKVDVVATAVGMSNRMLEPLKERFVKFGLEAALERRKPCTPSRKLVFDGEFAAQLTWPAHPLRLDGRVGRYACWRRSSWNFRSFRPYRL